MTEFAHTAVLGAGVIGPFTTRLHRLNPWLSAMLTLYGLCWKN